MHSILATTYPGGAGAMLSGMAWFVVGSCSAVAALVALALSPFTRTAAAARGLSRVALWGGLLAVVLVLIATIFIAVDRDVEFGSAAYGQRVGESLLVGLGTAIVPVVAVGAGYWSRQTARRREL
jgi:hypothetical protein